MSNEETKTTPYTLGRFLYGIYWMANFIWAIKFWGGWAIFWNLFVPYALLWDVITKFSHAIR